MRTAEEPRLQAPSHRRHCPETESNGCCQITQLNACTHLSDDAACLFLRNPYHLTTRSTHVVVVVFRNLGTRVAIKLPAQCRATPAQTAQLA
ncbi:hypothetical protein CDAR_366991 [Caerostris darwini]|uniref:Uncharacterized protein n=1 Tax=Caerostris darwini TaxID=1538125 RepID=A0AAV4WLM3_9ARAC|nr:hypothetical protein CDAR_366991 [Caerostris darwini]